MKPPGAKTAKRKGCALRRQLRALCQTPLRYQKAEAFRKLQGTRSEKGLENHSVLRSLFETARRQGGKAHQFFLDLFTKNTAQAQAALYRKPLQGKARPP